MRMTQFSPRPLLVTAVLLNGFILILFLFYVIFIFVSFSFYFYCILILFFFYFYVNYMLSMRVMNVELSGLTSFSL